MNSVEVLTTELLLESLLACPQGLLYVSRHERDKRGDILIEVYVFGKVK
jgi:hypothetical protein